MNDIDKKTSARKALILAAQKLFTEKGYAVVSTRELAEEANVNLGAIQYHFGSKANLFVEAVQSMTGAESIAPDHMGRARVPAQGYVPQALAQADPALMHQVQTLLFRQAAMLDAKCWVDWISLFSDDGVSKLTYSHSMPNA